MKKIFFLIASIAGISISLNGQQPVANNRHFSIGSYGRVGIARGDNDFYPRSLNLNGMGSIGGRMEEADYFELATALRFAPVTGSVDTTRGQTPTFSTFSSRHPPINAAIKKVAIAAIHNFFVFI